MSKPGVVNIHGKEYQTVALRVQTFREKHPTWSLITKILHRDENCVVMEALISDESGRVIANGHAEEYRTTSSINRISALENSETSAIGRALAALGFGGTEFASADEVANAINNKQPATITPSDGALDNLSADQLISVTDDAKFIVDSWNGGDKLAAYDAYMSLREGDQEYLTAVWHVLKPHSAIRNGLKKMYQEEQNGKA